MNNVLKRFVEISNKYKSKFITRLTSDCPFIDPKVIDQILYLIKKVQQTMPPILKIGLGQMVLIVKCLLEMLF